MPKYNWKPVECIFPHSVSGIFIDHVKRKDPGKHGDPLSISPTACISGILSELPRSTTVFWKLL
jgi:hypothetical protein